MSPRTPSEMRAAARAAAKLAPSPAVVGKCLKRSRELYGVTAVHPDAATAFRATKRRGKGPAPAGALHWWLGGSQGFGHVAPGESPTRVWSIDNVRVGGIDLVTLDRIRRTWPALKYAGWTRDLNGVTVVPMVRLGDVLGETQVRPAIRIVTQALVEERLLDAPAEHWSSAVLIAYARWQERAGFGPATPGRPGPSDGRPGIKSLTTLGLRRGFVVG